MIILAHGDVARILRNREQEVLDAVADAYRAHQRGATSLPHSVFLRFPGQPRNRVIGLPAYLGDDDAPVAGIKWIASFPGNLDRGLARASALMVLNDPSTGRPVAVLEASAISARRTGASAALAAGLLQGARPDSGVALIGCGVINFEVLRFLRRALPHLHEVTVYDVAPDRAQGFAARCAAEWPDDPVVDVARDAVTAIGRQQLVSIATTAARPHLDLSSSQPGSLILHVSLRDLTVGAILASDNVVDDVDHVCREQTSLHLAAQQVGNRRFIRGTIGGLLQDGQPTSRAADRPTVFSPFGLGILDLAVARLVWACALKEGLGLAVPDFLP
jgi:ornithine cyclodeaminase